MAEVDKIYYVANRESMIANSKRWNEKYKDKVHQYKLKYRVEHREELAEKARKRRQAEKLSRVLVK